MPLASRRTASPVWNQCRRSWEGWRSGERSAGRAWGSECRRRASPRIEVAIVAAALAAARGPSPGRRETAARLGDLEGSGAARSGAFGVPLSAESPGSALLGLRRPVRVVLDANILHLTHLLAPEGLLLVAAAPVGNLVPLGGSGIQRFLWRLWLGQRLGDLARELPHVVR